ncbi:MAG: hypothetical protein KGY39_02200 [Anaerolineales bacterium]|nr:hypothetical protein [Anaerolineales bacterium]MBS3752968.1 hypothetical protein [Anaerolineales bacterium]
MPVGIQKVVAARPTTSIREEPYQSKARRHFSLWGEIKVHVSSKAKLQE